MLRTPTARRPEAIEDLLDPQLIARIGRLDFTSKKIFAGKLKGERRSKKRGESVEFADHRPYVVGDDIRHIDWNIYGRLDRLFLKLFLEEEDLSLHLVLDASESSACGEPNKFLYMQKLAMALGYIGLVNLNRVAATAIGDAEGGIVSSIRDLRGRRRTQDLARWICTLEPVGTSDFVNGAKRIALTRRGKGVMIVMSDFFLKEGYEDPLRLLVGRGYDVFAIQVLSPQEVDPTGPGGIAGDLRLRDVEDGDTAEITVSAPLLKRYKANLSAYCDHFRTFCARRDIMSMTVTTDTPVDTLILDYLRARGLLR
jgi:uncharacterized protein (DUF58 family)